jgi:hypothetical protein
MMEILRSHMKMQESEDWGRVGEYVQDVGLLAKRGRNAVRDDTKGDT